MITDERQLANSISGQKTMSKSTRKIAVRILGLALFFLSGSPQSVALPPKKIPPKTVVLTFDDAVKTHLTVVAPLLKELGFRATFFITPKWMDDPQYFLTWSEVAKLHQMGFEIGNHSWTHANFGTAESGAKLGAELELVEAEGQTTSSIVDSHDR
jgi:peptidoglycan/xylan/chitin deacetylase (PgdA/CDA1 family)